MGKGRRAREKAKQSVAEPSPKTYDVLMTETAAAAYKELYRKAREAEERGDPTNSHCTTFRMVEEAIKVIIPRDPINTQYALAGELSNIFRLKKGRYRICWIASSEQKKVCVLFISETLRKQGSLDDPYYVFTKTLMSGEFDEIFSRLGVRKPVRTPTVQ